MITIYANHLLRFNDVISSSSEDHITFFESELENDPPKFIIEEAYKVILKKEGVYVTSAEHVVLVLCQLIRRKQITIEDVCLKVFDGKQWMIMPIDEDGEFEEEWEGGFFEERLNLLID